jgi:hypothetical protein
MKWRVKMRVWWYEETMIYFVPGFRGLEQFIEKWWYTYKGPNGNKGQGHSIDIS